MRKFSSFSVLKSVRHRAVLVCVIAAGFGMAASAARAAVDYTWQNLGTDFNTAANWSPSGVPGSMTGDNALLATVGTAQPNLSASVSINSLSFSTAASTSYLLSASPGQALTLTSTGSAATSAGSALTALYTGSTASTISAPLVLGGGAASTQTFVKAGQGTASTSSTLNITGGISELGAGTNLNFTGTGTGIAVFSLSAASSYTGNTTITGFAGATGNGTSVLISNAAALGTGSTITVTPGASGARLQLQNGITLNKTLNISGVGSGVGLPNALDSLTGLNIWSGTINANTGTSNVRVTSSTAGAANLFTISGGVALSGTAAFVPTGAGDGLISGVISTASGTPNIIKTGAGTWTFSGANTYTGKTTVQQGTLSVATLNNVVGGTSSSNLGAPTSAANGTIDLGNSTNTAGLTYTGSGETTDRAIGLAGTTGTVTLTQGGTGLLKFTSNLAVSGAGTKTFVISGSTAGTGEISGAISNNSASFLTNLQKTGTGTWTVSGANTYSGTTTVSQGTLIGIGANAFGSTSIINLTGSNSAVLSLRGDSSTSFVKASDSSLYTVAPTSSGASINVNQATIAGSSLKTMTIGAHTTTSTTATYAFGFTGANSTSLTMGSFTGPASVAAATVTLTNSIATPGILTLASYTSANTLGGETVTFTGTGNTTVTGAITPGTVGLALTKAGTGTLTLSGASTYAGVTTVSAGMLVVNGSTTSNAVVSASGTLGGSGTIAGTLSNTGIVAPGNSIGTLTVVGDATFNAGSTYTAELGASNSSDLLNLTSVGSNLGLASLTDTLNLQSTLDPGTFTIIDYNGSRAGGIFDLVSFNNVAQGAPTVTLGAVNPTGFTGTGDLYNYGAFSVFYNDSNTSVQVGITAIPEPSTFVLGGLALLGFASVGLRRRRAAKN